LIEAIHASDLPKYVYSYPSKRAYRPMEPQLTIERIWTDVEGAINLYIHVPFCRYRCAFCTLFMTTSHDARSIQAYVDAVVTQMQLYSGLLRHLKVNSLYIGGGTPTVLTSEQFTQLISTARGAFPAWDDDAEITVESAPDTLTDELLGTLRTLGVNRFSMGLQTIHDEERKRLGRPYDRGTVDRAVETIDRYGFDNVNYDLIYGLEGQSRDSWIESLTTVADWQPQTITIYPVIFRPHTSIERRRAGNSSRFMKNESKYALYDESLAYLTQHGYQQNSFVRFSTCDRDGLRQEALDFAGVPLIGFGVGSRSYTANIHYGTDFTSAGGRSLDITRSFIAHDHRLDEVPSLGFVLGHDEQKRRFCILNLSLGKLDSSVYRRQFGSDVRQDFGTELQALLDEGCATCNEWGVYRLTARGFKYSNVIAKILQSERVTELEARFIPT